MLSQQQYNDVIPQHKNHRESLDTLIVPNAKQHRTRAYSPSTFERAETRQERLRRCGSPTVTPVIRTASPALSEPADFEAARSALTPRDLRRFDNMSDLSSQASLTPTFEDASSPGCFSRSAPTSPAPMCMGEETSSMKRPTPVLASTPAPAPTASPETMRTVEQRVTEFPAGASGAVTTTLVKRVCVL
eukprot:m.296765 g.296765  ORF g.296765 m.296765 type:complete len:189 (+) comp13458_c0_seq1:97-663(+)